jgi:hypothetical protein
MSKVRVVLDVETIFEEQGILEVTRIVGHEVEHNFGGEVASARLLKVEEYDDE